MDDHCVQLVCVPPLDDWVVQAGQQRVHGLGVEGRFLLVAIDLFVGQLPVEVVLVEGEGEGEVHVVGQFALKHVEPLHLDHEDAGH